MLNRFGMVGLSAALLAVASLFSHAQTAAEPGTAGGTAPRQLAPRSVTTTEGGTTVFRGVSGAPANGSETLAFGTPDGSAQANPAGGPGGTTVFRGAPGGTSPRSGLLGASPPPAPSGPAAATGR